MNRIAVIALLTLSGCSAYNNKFDCPYGSGLGCASVSRVNRLIDNKQIDLDEENALEVKKHKVMVYYGPSKMSQMLDIDAR